MIHGHGDDIYSQHSKIESNFSSNVFDQGDRSWLRVFLQDKIDILTSYPEPNATSLVRLLAEKNKVAEESICATHGATDAIYLIAQAFAKSKTAIFVPTFSEYEDACRINQHNITFLKDIEGLKTSDFDTVWLCNPNNPTGKTWNYDLLVEVVDNHSNTVFVIDQTYHYFTPKTTLSYADAVKRENVIIIDSFTKRFALPDLRLGYFAANEELIKKVQFYKQPWAVSQLAIEVGKYVLESAPYALDLNTLLKETKYLQDSLVKLRYMEVFPSDTHFFLCKLHKGTAAELKEYLVKQHKILIRDAANFQGLNASYFRISTQQRKDNDRLIVALKQYEKIIKEQ